MGKKASMHADAEFFMCSAPSINSRHIVPCVGMNGKSKIKCIAHR